MTFGAAETLVTDSVGLVEPVEVVLGVALVAAVVAVAFAKTDELAALVVMTAAVLGQAVESTVLAALAAVVLSFALLVVRSAGSAVAPQRLVAVSVAEPAAEPAAVRSGPVIDLEAEVVPPGYQRSLNLLTAS